MIEDKVRDAFARHEVTVASSAPLAARIGAEVRRRRDRRRGIRVATATMAVLLLAAGTPFAVRHWPGSGAVAPGGSPSSGSTSADAVGPINLLIVGVDASGTGDPAHTDSIIIAHVPADRSAVQLVTIPRDLGVNLPPTGSWPGGFSKINAAYEFGGMPATRAAVTALTGLTFTGTVAVSFGGLTRLVDTLGGVSYCLDQAVTSGQTHVVYPPGCRTYSGNDMRDLLRQRVGLPNGSLDRDRHNAQFLAALATQLRRTTSLLDVGRLAALYASVRSDLTIQLDGGADPVALAWSVRSAFDSTATFGMPVVNETHDGLEDQRPAQDAAGLFAAMRDDTLTAWLYAHRRDPSGARDK